MWLVVGCREGESIAIPTSTTTPSTTTTPLLTLPPPASSTAASDRVLVLVQLLGGNDPLNTLVPSDGRYRDARPSVALDENDVLPLSGRPDLALHPSLAPLLPRWDDGTMAVVAGVGFDDQTRSHFESRDVWWRGTSDASADGWLARWMDAAAIDQPDDPLEAIALGAGPRALAGSNTAAVNDPSDFRLDPPPDMTVADYETFLLAVSQGSMSEGALLRSARGAVPLALSTQKIIADIGDLDAGDAYADRNAADLDLQLRVAADLIATRPGLRVVTVGIEGFDTHANQLATHANLLDQVARSLADFWEALGPADQQRSLVMTTTEFGRRVAENGSNGTDHGRASTQFLLGGGVVGGQVAGGYELASLVDGDLPIAVKAVDLYADALRWLGGPVDEVLGSEPQSTGLVMF
jgi:uncharacterized protein (DUF1501 family)